MTHHPTEPIDIGYTQSTDNSEDSASQQLGLDSDIDLCIESDVEVLNRCSKINEPDEWTSEEVTSSPIHTTTSTPPPYDNTDAEIILKPDKLN